MGGSPIKLQIVSDSNTTFTLTVDDEECFVGSGVGSYFVFLQSVIEPLIAPSYVSPDSTSLLIAVNDHKVSCSIDIENEDGDTKTLTFTVHKGGLSAAAFRALGAASAFTARFKTGSSRFFTTRGTGSITMRRKELSPMLFVYGSSCAVTIGDNTETLSGTSGQTYALNLAALARKYPDEDTISIAVDGASPFVIHIEPDRPSRHSMMVRFMNSLGWWELVEFFGAEEYGLRHDDDGEYTQYDALTDSYPLRRDSIPSHGVITAHCGYRSQQQLLFLQDLVASPEVYVDYQGREERCVAACDSFAVRINDNRPGDLAFTFTLSDETAAEP